MSDTDWTRLLMDMVTPETIAREREALTRLYGLNVVPFKRRDEWLPRDLPRDEPKE